MIYRKIYPAPIFEPRSRIIVVDEDGEVLGEICAKTAAVADAAANAMITMLQRDDADREHVRMRTIDDQVVEIGSGSGEGE